MHNAHNANNAPKAETEAPLSHTCSQPTKHTDPLKARDSALHMDCSTGRSLHFIRGWYVTTAGHVQALVAGSAV